LYRFQEWGFGDRLKPLRTGNENVVGDAGR